MGRKLVRWALVMSACLIVLAIAFFGLGYLETGDGLFVLGAWLFVAASLAAVWLVALILYVVMKASGAGQP